MSVTVVIPTTGAKSLKTAVDSVLDQTYDNITLWVIIDGPQFEDAVYETLGPDAFDERLFIMTVPENTGAKGYYGHRIYAAVSHLINTDYLCYLDQDNWFKPIHVKSMVDLITSKDLDWVHSLRSIHSATGKYVCEDKCESLGKQTSFVDTSCYMVKRQVAVHIGHAWHAGWGADRQFYSAASQFFNKFESTGLHTLNYCLGGNEDSVTADFFLEGNKRSA